MKRIFSMLQAQNWQSVCGAASNSLHRLWPLSAFTSTVFSPILSCFRLLVCIFHWTFELCVSLWAECALQSPGTSSRNSVVSGRKRTSNLAGNIELWQGAPWSSSSPGPLFCPGPMEFFQTEPWTGQSLLSWCLGLWSCSIPCSGLSGLWTTGGCPASAAALTDPLCWICQQKKRFSLQQRCPETLPADLPVVSDHPLEFYQSFQWIRWKRQQCPLFFVCSYLLW